MAAEQQADLAAVEVEEADIVAAWQRPTFDVPSSTVGVFDAERLVAYAEVTDPWRGDAAVLPAYHGRGVGTALAAWTRSEARARGAEVFGMPVPQGSPGDRLLERLGYFVRWTSWVLRLPEGREVTDQPLPPGCTIRTAATPEDHRTAHAVIEDAFLEWSERPRQPFEDFAATTLRRPGFESWHLRVAVDPDGVVVGACFVVVAGDVGYIDSLAVRRDRRGLGLARSLMVDAFSNAREHGAARSELATDSRTGALGLYEGGPRNCHHLDGRRSTRAIQVTEGLPDRPREHFRHRFSPGRPRGPEPPPVSPATEQRRHLRRLAATVDDGTPAPPPYFQREPLTPCPHRVHQPGLPIPNKHSPRVVTHGQCRDHGITWEADPRLGSRHDDPRRRTGRDGPGGPPPGRPVRPRERHVAGGDGDPG